MRNAFDFTPERKLYHQLRPVCGSGECLFVPNTSHGLAGYVTFDGDVQRLRCLKGLWHRVYTALHATERERVGRGMPSPTQPEAAYRLVPPRRQPIAEHAQRAQRTVSTILPRGCPCSPAS